MPNTPSLHRQCSLMAQSVLIQLNWNPACNSFQAQLYQAGRFLNDFGYGQQQYSRLDDIRADIVVELQRLGIANSLPIPSNIAAYLTT